MPLSSRFLKNMAQSGIGPKQGVVRDADLLRNLVGGFETNAGNVFRQAIRIASNLLNRVLAVGLVNPNRPARAYTIGVQKNHDVANDLLLRPCVFDAASSHRTNPLDILKPAGFFFDYVKNLFAKLRDQLFGVGRPDAFYHSAAKIFLNALLGRGSRILQQVRFELETELAVTHPVPFGR